MEPIADANLFWVQANSALPLLSYTEIKSIETEAKLRTGDILESETALYDTIDTSMKKTCGLSKTK